LELRSVDPRRVGEVRRIESEQKYAFQPSLGEHGSALLVAAAVERDDYVDGEGEVALYTLEATGAQRSLPVHVRGAAYSRVLTAPLGASAVGVLWSGRDGVLLDTLPSKASEPVGPAVVSMR
jgi:hypothetical protein